MYREGQSRGRPNETEGGRTVVRIATPASVLQPRPRSTVHDFRAPPVLFFPRSSQRQKKRNVRSKGGLRFPGGDACYLSTEGSWSIDRRNERKPARKISVAFPVASFSRHFSSPVRWPRLRYHPPCGFGRSNLWHSEPRRSLRRSELQRGRVEEYLKNRWMVSSYCYHEMQQPRCMDRCTGGGCRFDGKPVGSSRNLASHPALPGTRGTRSWNVRAYIPCWSIPCELLTYKEWQSMLTRWGGVRWQWGAESSCRRSRSRGRHQRT